MVLCGYQQSARSRTHKAGGQWHSAAGAGGCSVPWPTQCALRALWCAGMLCYALGGVTGRVSSNGGGGELDGQSACWCGSLDCLFAAIVCLSLLAPTAPGAAWGPCMRVACWLECPSPHWRRGDRLSLGALVYPRQHCAPFFMFSATPQHPPPLSLDFTVCMRCGSFFFLVCSHPGTRYHLS